MILAPLLLLLTCAMPAQTPPASGAVEVVRPKDNGYDDLMAAYAALTDNSPSDLIKQAELPTATLAEKRAAIREPRVQSALALLRDALDKPRIVPLESQTLHGLVAVFPLMRLLAVEEYVQLADGSTASAIDTFAEALSLGDSVQSWSLGSVKTGESLIERNIAPIAAHLDRLSDGDCSRLQALLQRELESPNPALAGLDAGKVLALTPIETFLESPVNPREVSAISPEDDATDTQWATLLRLKLAPANERKAFLDAVAQDVASDIDFLKAQITAYPDAPAMPPSTASLTDASESAFAAEIAQIATAFGAPATQAALMDRIAESRARLQLLAVHAAVHRYQWEHDALPETLASLNLGPLAVDPFTRDSLAYARTAGGTRYTLACAGPPVRGSEGKPVPTGERKSLSLLAFP